MSENAKRRNNADTSHDARQVEQHEVASVPATFTLLYESRDGRLCVFEDSDGHLTAVRAANLA